MSNTGKEGVAQRSAACDELDERGWTAGRIGAVQTDGAGCGVGHEDPRLGEGTDCGYCAFLQIDPFATNAVEPGGGGVVTWGVPDQLDEI